MLSVTISILGVLIFIVAMLDIFLSEAQKSQIDGVTVAVWSYLDDASRISIYEYIMRRKSQLAIKTVFSLLSVGCSIYLVLMSSGTKAELYILGTIIMCAILIAPTVFVIYYSFKAKNLTQFITRSTLILLLIALPTLGFIFFEIFRTPPHLTPPPKLENYNPTNFDSMLGLALDVATSTDWEGILAIFTYVLFSLMVLLFWLATVGPIFVVFVMAAFIKVSEFLVRKIAQYPKGVVLAIAAILAGLSGLLQSLS